MAVVTIEHLAEDVARLHDADRQLAVDIRDITSGLATVRAELRFALRIAGALAALVLPRLGDLIWQTARLSNEVKHQGERLDKLEAKVDQGFAQVMQRLDQVVAKTGGAK
jgi:hypothetical protein